MRLLRVNEVADRLNVSEARAYQLLRDGLLPSVRLGRQIRVEERALEQWVAAGGQELPGGWRREPQTGGA